MTQIYCLLSLFGTSAFEEKNSGQILQDGDTSGSFGIFFATVSLFTCSSCCHFCPDHERKMKLIVIVFVALFCALAVATEADESNGEQRGPRPSQEDMLLLASAVMAADVIMALVALAGMALVGSILGVF